MRCIPFSFLLLGAFTVPIAAQTPTFTKIADTNTVAPDSGGSSFSSFGDAREISGSRVAFYAFHGSGSGIYTYENGVLARLVDTNTLVPGAMSNFSTFFDVSIDGGLVAFSGGWPGPGGGCAFSGSEGLFVRGFQSAASPILVRDSLSFPDQCFHGVELDNGFLFYAGGVNPVDVVHNHSEEIKVATGVGVGIPVVDLTTTKPSGGNFIGFDGDFHLQNNKFLLSEIIVNTFGAVNGLYLMENNGLGPQVVADTSTAVPGGAGNFMNFASADFDGTEVAFMGRDSNNAGALYAGTSPANIRRVAGAGTPVPGEVVNFLGISNLVAIDGGAMAFSGYWSGGDGLFVSQNGVISSVVKRGDVLDGRPVQQAFCRPGSMDGNFLLVDVRFLVGMSLKPALYLVEL
ncbi:MAG: hypothetical protein COA70_04005 [Planctomycetota bacterium]|nr:MAG: hypothetical protein COA70_04005 [Planctomycetota bacterium]